MEIKITVKEGCEPKVVEAVQRAYQAFDLIEVEAAKNIGNELSNAANQYWKSLTAPIEQSTQEKK